MSLIHSVERRLVHYVYYVNGKNAFSEFVLGGGKTPLPGEFVYFRRPRQPGHEKNRQVGISAQRVAPRRWW
jgi:hypothetical protein